MKRTHFSIMCMAVIAMACQPPPPCEKQYFTESPEIDMCKNMVNDYLSGNMDGYTDYFADTARIWRNIPWTDAEGNLKAGITPDSLVAELQQGLEGVSSYNLEPQVWEMIIADDGGKWVHFWSVWRATFDANNKTYNIPVHLSLNVQNNKIIYQGDIFNTAEIAMDMMALQQGSGM